MSFFLVGGGVDDGLGEVYDEFIAEARSHTGRQGGKDTTPAHIAVVVAGPAEVSGDHAAALSGIVASRWPEAEVTPIHLTGPGTSPAPAQESQAGKGGAEGDVTTWAEAPDFSLPGGLDTLDGIIVGGGRVASYIAGLGPAAELLSRLVRGGAPWLGFSAGAMVTAVAAVEGGWRLNGRQIAPRSAAEGTEELTISEGLGLVSITSYAHNDVLSADGLLISAVDGGLLHSAVAIDEGTCLKVQQGSGRVTVMGEGLVRWFTKDPVGVVVRSERSVHRPSAPAPTPPKFAGLAQVAAATRAAHKKEAEQADNGAQGKGEGKDASEGQAAQPSTEVATRGKAGRTVEKPRSAGSQVDRRRGTTSEANADVQSGPDAGTAAAQAGPETVDASADATPEGPGRDEAEKKTAAGRKPAKAKTGTSGKTSANGSRKGSAKSSTGAAKASKGKTSKGSAKTSKGSAEATAEETGRSSGKSSSKASTTTSRKTTAKSTADKPSEGTAEKTAKKPRRTQKKNVTDTADEAGSAPTDTAEAGS